MIGMAFGFGTIYRRTLAAWMSLAMLHVAQPCATADAATLVLGKPSINVSRDLIPPNADLVGFNFGLGVVDGRKAIRTIDAIYRSNGKTFESRLPSPDDEVLHIEARPNYCVGGTVGQFDDALRGLRVVFMRRRGDHLDPSDTYESRWVGYRLRSEETKLLSDGPCVAGIATYSSKSLTALELILADASGQSLTAPPISTGRAEALAAVKAIEKIGGARDRR